VERRIPSQLNKAFQMLLLNVADVVFECRGILLHVARNMS
jgi:hypothetical protein